VLIAVPHKLHATVSIDFLEEKKPVLCEKPIATSTNAAKEMLETSQKYDTPLAVGFIRRFYNSSKQVKEVISTNILGRIRSFDFEEGSVYDWRTLSGFYFDKKAAGGGVLVDTGSHTLDLLLWWLGFSVSSLKYKDDNLGGVEANCVLELTMNHENNSFSGRIELSRERNLRNSYRIFGTHGWLEYSLDNTERINLHLEGKSKRYLKEDKPSVQTKDVLYYFAEQLRDFGRVVAHLKDPHVDGGLAYEGIKLMEACYSHRKTIDMPWITTSFEMKRV
jgi:predicted dehydrogenase